MTFTTIGNGLYVRVSPKKSPVEGKRPCAQCKTAQSRWDSIYCSDQCKQHFHAELRGER